MPRIRKLEAPFLALLLVTGCAFFGNRRQNVQDKTPSVPKAQYDELLSRYEDLQRKIQENATVQEPPVPAVALRDIKDEPSPVVDAFQAETPAAVAAITPKIVPKNMEKFLNQDLASYQKGLKLFHEKKLPESMDVFKDLVKSASPHVQARARLKMGDIFFEQNEFDLAMQVYEDVLNKFAYSAVVYKALGQLIVCGKKLNLPEKEAKYQSLLKDVLGKKESM